jgi:hypothetical protein
VSRAARGTLLALLCLAAGCDTGDAGPASSGRLEVRWTGADTAAFAAPATAEWCDSLSLLEIRATAGDTGVGLAVYRRGGIAPGHYPIRPPDSAGMAPPAAAVGLRWFSQTAVQGFQATGGALSLRRGPDGALAGTFAAKANAVNGGKRLTVTGSFEGVRASPAARGCYAPPPPDTSAGVH